MLGSNIISFLSSDKDSGLRFTADSRLSASFTKYVYILRNIREMAAFIANAGGNALYLT